MCNKYMVLTGLNGTLRVIDLTLEDPTSNEAIVWTWTPTEEKGWKVPFKRLKYSIDDAKLRWSEYYQREVVLITSSWHWAGIADYATGECLWEWDVPNSPHSVDMLPNGDIVIAGSGRDDHQLEEGCLMYYSISKGEQCQMEDCYMFPRAHGAVWDPQNEVLWAVGMWELAAFTISPEGKLCRIENKGGLLPSDNGHDLSQDYCDADLLMISSSNVYKFSKSQNKFLTEYAYSDILYAHNDVKGVSNYKDGTATYCIGTGVTTSYGTDTFYVIEPGEEPRSSVQKAYVFEDFSFYKLRNFTKECQ